MKAYKYYKVLLVATFLLSLVIAGPVFAQSDTVETGQEGSEKAKEAGASKYKIRKPTYTYKSSGNRDPFRSLIQTEVNTEAGGQEKRAPLESYNVSQLRLIAIVSAIDEAYALVVLPDGKSYTVREGMNLGLHGGIVKEIRSDEVVVEESIKDHKGKLKLEEVHLRLRQEGDK